MAEVPFRPVRQLSEYKGKGASASREWFFPCYAEIFCLNNVVYVDMLLFNGWI